MPAKQKKGRGKTVNLLEYNEDYVPEDALDWAEDDWMTAEQVGEAKLSEKIARQRQEYSRVANNALDQQESFRTAAASEQKKRFTIDDLQPPFVAHFGNLRNGTTDEDFLALFNRDSITTHRLINQDGKSFAFVEFVSAQALTVALSLDQTFQRGRRMYVDLATQKQVERLLNRNTAERPGMSRDGAGQQQPGGLAAMELTRDVFGGQQPEDQPGMPNMGNRSNFGSRADLHNLGDLSRDMLGSAVQHASPVTGSPMGNAGSPVNFASWRNDAPEQQPDFAMLRENNRSEESLDRRAGNLRRTSGTATPAQQPPPPPEPKPNPFGGDTGNWRDAPRAEAPKMEEPAPAAPAAPATTTAPAGSDAPAPDAPRKSEEAPDGSSGSPASGAAAGAAPAAGSPSNFGRGRGGGAGAGGFGRGAGGPGRGGRGGRGAAGPAPSLGGFMDRNVAPKPSGPVSTDKWADLRRN